MKITSVDIRATTNGGAAGSLLVLGTDASVVGIGEWAESAHGLSESSRGALASVLVGRDPFDVQALSRDLPPNGNDAAVDTAVLAAASTAMVDICGKHLGVPAHQFLGGRVRDRVRACAIEWEGPGDDPDESAAAAIRTIELGFDALRIGPRSAAAGPDRTVAETEKLVHAIRRAAGDEVDLIVAADALEVGEVKALSQALAPHEPLWLECVFDRASVAALAADGLQLPVPLTSAAETEAGVRRDLMSAGLVDHVTLDVGLAGGLHAARRISALAEINHIGIVPTGATPISFAIALHLAAAIPNLTMVQMRPGLARVVDGMIDVDLSSGLGIDVLRAATMEVA